MKQLRKTEWRRGYPIKKNLALCAWGVLALAGFAGILARPENIPSLAACVLLHWRAQSFRCRACLDITELHISVCPL